MTPLPQPIAWYKTKLGKSFLGVLTILLTVVVGFTALVVYYFWNIKYGDGERIAAQFNDQFTVDPTKDLIDNSPIINASPADYIRAHNPTLGPDDAPITIIAFIDFECPFCQASYPIFKNVSEQYGQIVKIVFKHLPVSIIHPRSMPASLAATCAQEQDKFWEFYDQIFIKKILTDSALRGYATDLGLDMSRFDSCVEKKNFQSNIDEDLIDAANLQVRGTPTYIFNQIKLEGVVPKAVWDDLIIKTLGN